MASEWAVHPEAEAAVTDALASALAASPRLRSFAERLHRDTSTRLVDWVDHLSAPPHHEFVPLGVDGLHRHPAAQLPALLVDGAGSRTVALRVDDADAFAHAHGARPAVGDTLSGLRRVEAWVDGDVRVVGIERRSWSAGCTPASVAAAAAAEAVVRWRSRPRTHDAVTGTAAARRAAEEMVGLVGPDLAASYAMAEERSYWQRRNRAARIQRGRQDRLGLGWGNHDHHTFRSSRSAFAGLLDVLGALGFERRERFFAGAEAGWGAQVLEHRGAGLVVFADVDLEPGEADVDFARALAPSVRLGTVGLWCGLHGESLLAAGMHHLAAQLDHDALIGDLAARGIEHMPPFSTLPHLWQAFTEAEMWPVADEVLGALVAAGQVTDADAARFRDAGAAGSHLEDLTRGGGFKGFNQRNVSTTIAATDPRAYRPETP